MPAALSFVEGQDDAPTPVVRNDAGAPDRLKDGSEPFHAVRAPVIQQLWGECCICLVHFRSLAGSMPSVPPPLMVVHMR